MRIASTPSLPLLLQFPNSSCVPLIPLGFMTCFSFYLQMCTYMHVCIFVFTTHWVIFRWRVTKSSPSLEDYAWRHISGLGGEPAWPGISLQGPVLRQWGCPVYTRVCAPRPWDFPLSSSLTSALVINWKQVGRKGFISAYRIQPIIDRSQGRRSSS